MKNTILLAVLLILAAVSYAAAQPGIHYVAQMNTEQIRALDHKRTVVLLPGGILEQHGPYLPSYTDGYINEHLSQHLAEAIVREKGRDVLIFPVIPLGVGGANEIGRKYAFPGSYNVRMQTMRDVFMDLGTELGEQGFRSIFIIHAHGAPDHNRTLDEAGDFFHDTYGGFMVHLTGLMPVVVADDSGWTDAQKKEEGFSVHAGAGETSWLMSLRSDLVGPITQARPQHGENMGDLVRFALAPNWPGYFGSPRLATAEEGRRQMANLVKVTNENAFKILDGTDPRSIARFGDIARGNTVNAAIDHDAQEHERKVKMREDAWLRKRKIT